MKASNILTLLVLIIALASCSDQNNTKLILNGTTTAPDIKSIILLKPGQDIRHDSVLEIPVTDGKFHYEATLEYPEAVDLVLGSFRDNGGGRFLPLFLENTTIDLKIYPEEAFDSNEVSGGKYNALYRDYQNDLEKTFAARTKALTDSLGALYARESVNRSDLETLQNDLEAAESDGERSFVSKQIKSVKKSQVVIAEQLSALAEERDRIYAQKQEFQRSYIEENPNLVAYYLFLNTLIYDRDNVDLQKARQTYEKLSKVHPDHPYNTLAGELITAMEDINVGEPFSDFIAPDLEGQLTALSGLIENKIALLDLWATWCAPCIRKSREMLPIYHEFKDKGFTVVGVAGEFKDTQRLERFLEKEQWPWVNLVELDRANDIWKQYGVDGGGGGMFLIDSDGVILAKDPTPEEVRAILNASKS
ncbi:TlpA disulfide reductase family protein [Robertkochia sediminum]|uniref:TlpA disulfide reductase family protein n=1 Tax=Robertkochia sediminum TaxID=2785326 RepID=UPI001932DCFE|nr:TlpA disulfide reductase family protein [Robertkochia sediminum]MBL7472099.1 AhpC/TSA family protein [Robertkochia sediminum]